MLFVCCALEDYAVMKGGAWKVVCFGCLAMYDDDGNNQLRYVLARPLIDEKNSLF